MKSGLENIMPQKTKTFLKYFKYAVTIILCSLIIVKADWKGIGNTIQRANMLLVIVVFGCMVFNIIVSAKKWQILLTIHNLKMKIGTLTEYYLSGMFFSNFLPSTIGGDAYRMFKIYQCHASKSGAIIPVVIERISGLIVLLFLGGIAATLSYLAVEDNVSWLGLWIGFGGSILSIIFIALGFHPIFHAWIKSLAFMPSKIKDIFNSIDLYRKHPKQILHCGVVTIIFYLFLFSYRYLMLRSTGADCPIFSLAMVTMLSTVIANLPISINGLGLLDGSFIYLISKFGVSYESALIVMLLQRTLTLAVSLSGGIFYLRNKDAVHKDNSVAKEKFHKMKESLS